MTEFEFTLDTHKSHSQISIPVRLNDTAVRLIIHITDGIKPYQLKRTDVVVFSAKKSDLKTLFNPCIIKDESTVIYEFTEQTATSEGLTEADIVVYSADNKQKTSAGFSIMVTEVAVNAVSDVVVSEDEQTAINAVIAAEVERIAAELLRVANEDARIAAEDERRTSEIDRKEAETARALNETKRVEAEQARAEAENGRVNFIKETAQNALDEAKKYTDKVSVNNDTIFKIERRVTNLENQLNPEFFLTDSTASHIKTVPGNACPYAQINSIGGITTKERVHPDTEGAIATNMVPLNGGENSSDPSLTCTYENGTLAIVANGVNEDYPANVFYKTGLTDYYLEGYYKVDIESDIPGVYANLDYGGDVDNGSIINLEYFEGGYGFRVHARITSDGTYYIKPRLYKYEKLIDNKVTAIKVKTPNILPFPYTSSQTGREVMDVGFKYNWAGVDWEVKADGSVVLNGTLSGTPGLVLSKDYLTFDKDVFVSGCPEGGSTEGYYITIYSTASSGTIFGYDVGSGKLIPAGTPIKISLGVYKGTVCDNLTFKPMITYGATKLPYSPPNEAPRVYEIPESIQSIEGYGESNPEDETEYNYIDCQNQKFVAKGYIDDGAWVRNESATETPITFDNFIEVEGASRIEFVNEHNANIPSSITYMLKEV